jgi:hypothetical protein
MKPRITIAVITAIFGYFVFDGVFTIEEAIFLEVVLLIAIALTVLLVESYRLAGRELAEEDVKTEEHRKSIRKDE